MGYLSVGIAWLVETRPNCEQSFLASAPLCHVALNWAEDWLVHGDLPEIGRVEKEQVP